VQWTFLAFFGIFELGSLICGVATSSKMLIVGRAIAGIGGSGILNGSFTIIAGCVPMPKRPGMSQVLALVIGYLTFLLALIGFVIGCKCQDSFAAEYRLLITGLVSQLGLVIGPLVGGALTQYTTWRWCKSQSLPPFLIPSHHHAGFYINLPIGAVVAAMLVFLRIPDQVPKPPPLSVIPTLPSKLDLIGFALFAPAAIQLLLALQYGGNQYAWNSSQIIGLFCGAGATFLLFLAWDYYKGDGAMIPFSMARKRTVWASCLVYGFMIAQVFCGSYYLPIYFQGVKGVTPTLSGVYLLPTLLSQLFSAISSGMLGTSSALKSIHGVCV
jgi:MFS family permease